MENIGKHCRTLHPIGLFCQNRSLGSKITINCLANISSSLRKWKSHNTKCSALYFSGKKVSTIINQLKNCGYYYIIFYYHGKVLLGGLAKVLWASPQAVIQRQKQTSLINCICTKICNNFLINVSCVIQSVLPPTDSVAVLPP